jgi:myo-inositol 2-dehydrogenase/D-chiro-inositol 1-dehydrogenase
MNFLILGAGEEELAWARAIAGDARHRVLGAYPGFGSVFELPRPADLDDALAVAGLEAVVVGGRLQERIESLRRVAAAGLNAICLHPPGDDAEAYYQVALSREETGAVVVPDLPLRLHPGLDSLRRAIDGPGPEAQAFRGLRIEWTVAAEPEGLDLARHVLPQVVDVVRALLGAVEALSATGDPPGNRPTESLVVQLRCDRARRAEFRIETGSEPAGRLVVAGATGSITLEVDPALDGPARLVRRTPGETVTELDAWDRHAAILDVFAAALDRSRPGVEVHPNLLDGTRAMELSEATARSLRRGRTVDLHYEEISEAGTFKGVMTSVGCVVFLAMLVVLPLALIGPPLGFPGTIYVAYLIPPVLVVFVLLQLLRLGIRSRRRKP